MSDKTTFPCTCPQEPCHDRTECERAGLCLGSDEGVAYQERIMKAFFDRLLTEYDDLSPTSPANAEMVKGYRDGLDLDAPEPSENRSYSYRHGFATARDDRRGKPRASSDELTRMADLAMAKDEALNV